MTKVRWPRLPLRQLPAKCTTCGSLQQGKSVFQSNGSTVTERIRIARQQALTVLFESREDLTPVLAGR